MDLYSGLGMGANGMPFDRAYGSNGYLRQLRDYTLQDALGAQAGMRGAAMRQAGDDPSMAAAFGLQGMLQGQGNASRTLAAGRLAWMKQRQDLLNQMRLMKYRMELEKTNPLWAAGGQAVGALTASLL